MYGNATPRGPESRLRPPRPPGGRPALLFDSLWLAVIARATFSVSFHVVAALLSLFGGHRTGS